MDLNHSFEKIIISFKSKERIIYSKDTTKFFQYYIKDNFFIIETIHDDNTSKEHIIPSEMIEDIIIIRKENVSASI